MYPIDIDIRQGTVWTWSIGCNGICGGLRDSLSSWNRSARCGSWLGRFAIRGVGVAAEPGGEAAAPRIGDAGYASKPRQATRVGREYRAMVQAR